MLIGFNGQMGVGKSTAIQVLKDYSGREVINVKFAQPLYDMQEYIYNRIADVYQRPSEFVKDRKLLQWLGTEWGRETIDKDLWIELWRSEVEDLLSSRPNAIVVCDDVRFDNEAEVVRNLGGKIIQIVSSRGQSRTVPGIANHSSEAGISVNFVDYVLENNDTQVEFTQTLNYLFSRSLGLAPGGTLNFNSKMAVTSTPDIIKAS